MSGPGEDKTLHRQRIRRRIGEPQKIVRVRAIESGESSFRALGDRVLDAGKAAADYQRRDNGDRAGRKTLGNLARHPDLGLGCIAVERLLRQSERVEGVGPTGAVLAPLRALAHMDDVRAAAVAVVWRQGAGDGGGLLHHDRRLPRHRHGDGDIDGGTWLVEVDACECNRLAGLHRAPPHRLRRRAARCLGELDLDGGIVHVVAAQRRGDGRHGVVGKCDGDIAGSKHGNAGLRGRGRSGVAVVAKVAHPAVGRRFVGVGRGGIGAVDRARVAGTERPLVDVKGEDRGDIGGAVGVDRGLGGGKHGAEERIAVNYVLAKGEVRS